MTVKEARQSIATHLEKAKTATAKEVHAETKIPYVMIYAAIKHFSDGGGITIEVKDDTKIYSVKDLKTLRTLAVNDAAPKISSKDEEDITATPTMKKYANVPTRDTSKYIFQKEKRGKGRTVLAVIQAYVASKRITLEKLNAAFPQDLVQKWGVVTSYNKAKDHDRQRYFVGDDDVIVTADKKKVAVTNQWTAPRFAEFQKCASRLGFRITKAD